MPVPFCGTCNKFMKAHKTGASLIELSMGRPYKIWACDAWKCQKCGNVTLSGYGTRAIAESYEQLFYTLLATIKEGHEGRDWFEEAP